MSYYTGVSFTLLAEGPGEPVGGGGRYDELLARFGAPQPATGFAIDVENLEWALAANAVRARGPGPLRVALAGGDSERIAIVADALRRQGTRVSMLHRRSRKAAAQYARAWGHDAAISVGDDGIVAVRSRDGETLAFDPHDPRQVRALSSWARSNVV